MYFDPDSFERIQESRTLNPCPYRPYTLAVVDSFALYMLLQLHIKGDRFAEQRVTIDVLRPVIAKSDDSRKNDDIIYLLRVLKGAGMINFELDGRNILYTISECVPKKLNNDGEPRKLVMIKRSNRHILEDYPSNVPFAIYCLLCSLRRWEDGVKFMVVITFKQMCKRLRISDTTLSRYKEVLEDNGYIRTYFGKFNKAKQEGEPNGYELFDYGHNKTTNGYKTFKMVRQRFKEKISEQRRSKKAGITAEPAQMMLDSVTEKKQLPESTK